MRTALPRVQRGHRYVQRDVALRCRSRCIVSVSRPRAFAPPRRRASHGVRPAIHEPFRQHDVLDHTHPLIRPHQVSTRTFASSRPLAADVQQPVVPQFSYRHSRDPTAWLAHLDRYLPQDLRVYGPGHDGEGSVGAHEQNLSVDCDKISTILDGAKQTQHAETDLIVRMVLDGRKKAALHIVDMLLRNLALKFPKRSLPQVPSNIPWPHQSLRDLCQKPIELETGTHSPRESFTSLSHVELDPRYAPEMSLIKDTTMAEIWVTLGTLVIESANMTESESSAVLNAVMLILGRIHSLDLMPENVYDYQPLLHNSVLQRPPILHLQSSRILTALSDAAWREQQNQMIEKATRSGVSYEEAAREAPGGRFRLKVRPLGPETWLELILWCCVEGGYADAGWRLVNTLRQQTENPWFAISWTSNGVTGQMTPRIDWDCVRMRTGGTVGRIEGYSRDKPLVEMPHRTISTEAILALVSANIESMNPARRGGTELEMVQRQIVDMISFLEPHDIPLSYFDYLAVRLMQTGYFNMSRSATELYTWFERMRHVKSLETLQPHATPPASFDLSSLSAHSELFAGILHQALEGYVQSGKIHQALEAFNILQQLVDESKLRAIGTFLDKDEPSPPSDLPSGAPRQHDRQDFVLSHGQLPLYKLLGLLDLTTDTGLIGFGQWLLYSDAPDGPLIPKSTFSQPAVTQALLRFATLSADKQLAVKVYHAHKKGRRKKTTRTLEALIHADFNRLSFPHARKHLLELKVAVGGGLRIGTLASLAGTILKLENGQLHEQLSSIDRAQHLEAAEHLLHEILRGDFTASQTHYTRGQQIVQRQHIASLIQICLYFPESVVGNIALSYVDKYKSGNMPTLPAITFNILMEAVIEAKGATAGIHMWERFCTDVADDDVDINEENKDDMPHNELTQMHGIHEFGDGLNEVSSPREPVAQHLNKSSSVDVSESSSQRPRLLKPLGSDLNGQFRRQEPVTVPNQRTLRLIVLRAIRDKRQMTESQVQNSTEEDQALEPDRVLEWAVKRYKAFNLGRDDIEFEIQGRLSDIRLPRERLPHRIELINESPGKRNAGKIRTGRIASDVEAQFGARQVARGGRKSPASKNSKPAQEEGLQAQFTKDGTFRRWLV